MALATIRGMLTRHRPVVFHWMMEIVVVVVGILIAFALQGWAEDAATERRARQAQARIRADLFDNALLFAERIAVDRCIRDRLAYLAAGLTSGAPDWRPDAVSSSGMRAPVLPAVFRLPGRAAVVDSYRAAVAANDIGGIDPLQRMYLDQLFGSASQFTEINVVEQTLASELKPLGAITLVTAGDRAATLGRIARLDDANRLMVLMAEQYFDSLRGTGMRPDAAELRRIRRATDWRQLAIAARRTYGPCWDASAIDRFDPRLR